MMDVGESMERGLYETLFKVLVNRGEDDKGRPQGRVGTSRAGTSPAPTMDGVGLSHASSGCLVSGSCRSVQCATSVLVQCAWAPNGKRRVHQQGVGILSIASRWHGA